MPRIPAALTLAAMVVFCIGFNTIRYPVVRQMLARPVVAAGTENSAATPKDEASQEEDADHPESDLPATGPNPAVAATAPLAARVAALAIRGNPPADRAAELASPPREVAAKEQSPASEPAKQVVCTNNVCTLAGTVQPASPEAAALAKTETSPVAVPTPAAPSTAPAMPARPPEMRCAMVPVRHDGPPSVAEGDRSKPSVAASPPAGPATNLSRPGKIVRHLPTVEQAATAVPVADFPLDGPLPIYPMTRAR